MELSWDEDYMLRQSYPMYDEWDSEEQNNNSSDYEAELERANYV